MVYKISSDELGRTRIIVADEPEYVVPLTISPSSLEGQLRAGLWLVVVMSVWSVYDWLAGRQAIEAAKRENGKIKVGLRPYNHPEENATWLPALEPELFVEKVAVSAAEAGGIETLTIRGCVDSSPVWVGISDGQFLAVWYGPQTDDAVEGIVSMLLASRGPVQ